MATTRDLQTEAEPPVSSPAAVGELDAVEAQAAEAREESRASRHVAWGNWRGSPELVSQIARTAQYGLTQATNGAEVECSIVVTVDDDVEQYSSPEAFNVGISGEALTNFSRMYLALQATRADEAVFSVVMVFQCSSSLWTSLNPFAGQYEIAILTVSGPEWAVDEVQRLTRWMYVTAKRGAPWWKVTPLKTWTEDGETRRGDVEFVEADPGGRRRDKLFGAGAYVLLFLSSAVLAGLATVGMQYLLGAPGGLAQMAVVVVVAAILLSGSRWVIPDVEIARYRETRLDKFARRGTQAGVSLLLAVLTKRVFRQ